MLHYRLYLLGNTKNDAVAVMLCSYGRGTMEMRGKLRVRTFIDGDGMIKQSFLVFF